MAAAEAQHCLRLHPEASLLGVTAEHLRESANVGMTGVCLAFYLPRFLPFSFPISLHPSLPLFLPLFLPPSALPTFLLSLLSPLVSLPSTLSLPLLQGSKKAVLQELEERLKAKCLRVVNWYSEGSPTGTCTGSVKLPRVLCMKWMYMLCLSCMFMYMYIQSKCIWNKRERLELYVHVVIYSTVKCLNTPSQKIYIFAKMQLK